MTEIVALIPKAGVKVEKYNPKVQPKSKKVEKICVWEEDVTQFSLKMRKLSCMGVFLFLKSDKLL